MERQRCGRAEDGGKGGDEEELTDEELDVYGEFSDALVTGKSPDIEEFLGKHVEMAAKLRPVLEREVQFYGVIQKLKQKYPNTDMLALVRRSLARKQQRESGKG
jgi:hypothetical protein